jgi:hypothetical protein
MVSSLPRLDRRVLIVFSLCLAAACLIHVADLWRHGWLPYHFAPLPLNAYWTALTFFDALASVLLLLHPRIGLALALLIISSDVALNLFARFNLGLHLRPLFLLLQALFLIAVVAATFYARRTGAATPSI